jgi:hypothetical protein
VTLVLDRHLIDELPFFCLLAGGGKLGIGEAGVGSSTS